VWWADYDRAYRARILFALNDDLTDELDFIDVIAEENPKNYQIFHHRQKIVEEMSKRGTANFERELDFTEQLIDADQKNYHVWSYRYLFFPSGCGLIRDNGLSNISNCHIRWKLRLQNDLLRVIS
jgi:hypothetical protein